MTSTEPTTTETTTEATTEATAAETAAPETPFAADVRARVEGIARDVVASTLSVAGQVGDLAGVTADKVRSELGQARANGRDRVGDVRGRVQPVVEQVGAGATRVVGAGLERARGLVGRGRAA